MPSPNSSRRLTWCHHPKPSCGCCRTRRLTASPIRPAPPWPMRCVSRFTSTRPGRRSARPLFVWVVPQAMPGAVAREEDTRLSDLLVAESEPDHDDIPGPSHIPPGFPPAVLVLSYRLRAACVFGDELPGAPLPAPPAPPAAPATPPAPPVGA